jgi:hypothetical protein
MKKTWFAAAGAGGNPVGSQLPPGAVAAPGKANKVPKKKGSGDTGALML